MSLLSSQLSKLACIPVTLIIQFVAYRTRVPTSVQMTLIPITFGVGYTTVYDLDINFVGLGNNFIFRLAWCLCVSFLITYIYFLIFV
jgi:hypothetical protein